MQNYCQLIIPLQVIKIRCTDCFPGKEGCIGFLDNVDMFTEDYVNNCLPERVARNTIDVHK
jgi:hypothetical protein